ncbi:uncharacterized protein LOC125679557 [Ostrea edulis]|uniref:uncharacterized protein LOC125679557 n=1 Tax=Ostrea edulis TaxID=37623 RepID=UPI0024AF461B|nr:uncharacterized protein LOC125679557 [Ostrea edulis]
MIRSDVTIHFTCTRCKRSQEETISGPRLWTQYGEFDVSIILGGVSGSNTCSLNATYIIETSDREGQTDTTGEDTNPPPTHNLTASFDVTRRPVGDEPEAIEVSLQEPALEEHILVDVPVTYKIIEQGSQRGKRKLVSSDSYEFVKKVSKGDFTYWRCSKRSKSVNCPATISQKGETFKANSRDHTHQADKSALKKVQVWKEVKSKCVDDVHKPARRVVEDAMLDFIDEDDHRLPNVRNLQRLANRVREDLRPAEPKDLEFVIDTDYLQCRDFLVGDILVDEGRHLIFSTPNQLRILQQARRWFCDGTFKILAKPFQQLWSIHAFVTKGESFKQVPLVFCLMSRRKGRDYVAVSSLSVIFIVIHENVYSNMIGLPY